MQCPVCQRYVSVTAGGSLRMHRAATGPAKCEASGVLPATARDIAAKTKPCRPMLGGETGEVPTTKTKRAHTRDLCTADDARGPA